jgi:hypothetical protein
MSLRRAATWADEDDNGSYINGMPGSEDPKRQTNITNHQFNSESK